MFYPLELKLLSMLLGCVWGLDDMVVSSPEMMAHVGDSALLGCILPSAVKKQVTKVNWMFSAGEYAEEEFVLYYYANLSVPVGNFKDRVHLVGKISDNDGSILLQDLREADQGVYTCEIQIHKESLVFKKTTMLKVVPAKPTTMKPTFRTDVLSNYQQVIIVGIVCFTILLLAVLGVTMRRRQRSHRSENHLENTSKANPEVQKRVDSESISKPERTGVLANHTGHVTPPGQLLKPLSNASATSKETTCYRAHVYSTVTTQSVTEEEESNRAEATYMTMQPVWPSWRAEQNKSFERMPETEQTFERPRFAIRPLTKEDNGSQKPLIPHLS